MYNPGSGCSSTRKRQVKGSKGSSGGSSSDVPSEARGGDKRRSKICFCKPVCKTIGYFGLALLVPTLLNYAVLNQESRMLVPKGGVMYDIGLGQKLLLKCSGSGLPTVVLDAPLGQSSDVWVLVEPLIAKTTRVCVYDRSGIGFSDRAFQNSSLNSEDGSEGVRQRDKILPSTAERMADDLHRLLSSSSNQPKPLLLVSSDFVTFASRFYAQVYEHEVGGLFLIDPAFEGLFAMRKDQDPSEQVIATWQTLWYRKIVPFYQGKWLTSVIGFNRISLMVGLMSPIEDDKLLSVLPEDSITRKKHMLCKPRHLSTVFDEHYYVNESMHQVRTMMTVKPFPAHLPVTIATYRKPVEFSNQSLSEDWKAGQEQMIKKLHLHSKRVVLPGKDYLTFYQHPRLVAAHILDMVTTWRKESKLAA